MKTVFAIIAIAFTLPLFAEVSATMELMPRQEAYYVGQLIRATLTITITDAELDERIQIAGLPDPSVIRKSPFTELAGESQVVDGKRLTTKRYVAQWRLLREGVISSAPVLSGATLVRQRRGPMTFQSSAPFTAAIQEKRLNVLPLPPAPENFSGAIGQFRVTVSSVTPSTASPGDLVPVEGTLSGFGSLDGMVPPKRLSTERFRFYLPREESSEPSVRVTFREVAIPQTLDSTVIEAVTFTVFNPVTGRYEPLAVGPFALAMTDRPVAELTQPPIDVNVGRSPAMTETRKMRLAPAATARVLGEIPAAAPVRVLETTERWQRVEYNGASGWILIPLFLR